MKRIVILFDSKFKSDIHSYLDFHRVQYSMFIDIYTSEVRLSVPRSAGIRFLAELRRDSIPYELI